MTKSVVAYEDDPALRKQLESIFINLDDEYKLMATFPDPRSVMTEMVLYKPDIVLMDLQMLQDDDGLQALYQIKQHTPNVKVMVLTMFDADQKVFNAICLGADGYMLKSDFSAHQVPHDAMRKSLQMIFSGGAYLTPSVAKQIMKLFSDVSITDRIDQVRRRFQSLFQKPKEHKEVHPTSLTRMQSVVLEGIVEGKTTSQMAREMELSENTINSHIKAIYMVLGVHSRALAVKKAMENRWIS